MSVVQDKIYILGVKLYGSAKGKHGPGIHPIDRWIVGIPIIYPQLLYGPYGLTGRLFLGEPHIWGPITLEALYLHDGVIPFLFSSPN